MRLAGLLALLAGCGSATDVVPLSALVTVTAAGIEVAGDVVACCDTAEARVTIVVTENAGTRDYSYLVLEIRDVEGDLGFLADGEPLFPASEYPMGASVGREGVSIGITAPCGFAEAGFRLIVFTLKKGNSPVTPDILGKAGSIDVRVIEEDCPE